MQFLEQGQSFALVLGGKGGDELRGQYRVTGLLIKRAAQNGFGIGVLLFDEKEMAEAGGGISVLWIFSKDAAVGFFRGILLAGLLGQLGGNEGVLRSFRRELEGFEEIAGGVGGV